MNPNLRFAIPYYQTELVARKIARRIGDKDQKAVREWLHKVITKSTTKQARALYSRPFVIYRSGSLAAIATVRCVGQFDKDNQYMVRIGTSKPPYLLIDLKTIAEQSRICSNAPKE